MESFKKRSDIHWARKLWHMGGVSLMAAAYAWAPPEVSLGCLAVGWILAVPADILRQTRPPLNSWLVKYFRPIMREHEVNRLAGTTYLLTGVGLVALIFPKEVVLLTLLFLAFADPFASYFGIRYGKDRLIGNKSVQGSLAAFVVCFILTGLYFLTSGLEWPRLLVLSLLAGVIGSLAELIPIGNLDDNLTLPLMSATFLWLLFWGMGVLQLQGV